MASIKNDNNKSNNLIVTTDSWDDENETTDCQVESKTEANVVSKIVSDVTSNKQEIDDDSGFIHVVTKRKQIRKNNQFKTKPQTMQVFQHVKPEHWNETTLSKINKNEFVSLFKDLVGNMKESDALYVYDDSNILTWAIQPKDNCSFESWLTANYLNRRKIDQHYFTHSQNSIKKNEYKGVIPMSDELNNIDFSEVRKDQIKHLLVKNGVVNKQDKLNQDDMCYYVVKDNLNLLWWKASITNAPKEWKTSKQNMRKKIYLYKVENKKNKNLSNTINTTSS